MPFTSAFPAARVVAAGAALILAGCAAPVAEAPLIRPKLLFNTCAKPEYPRDALRNRQTGTSTMSFLVGKDGLVHDAAIRKSSGYPSLDQAALVLRHCQFTPATRGGKPVEVWEPVRFVWSLE